MSATVSTHVLDTARGKPAAGIAVTLYALGTERRLVRAAMTNADGRTDAPLGSDLGPGAYEIIFAVTDYFARRAVASFFDEITIRFHIAEGEDRYHVPLLLAPWGYSTYRGS